MIPKILKNYNMVLNGVGFAGRVDQVELPKLQIQIEEHRGGGQDSPAAIDMGMELIECGFECSEHSPEFFANFGLQDGNAVQIRFLAAAADDLTVDEYEVEVHGLYKELDGGTLKAGDKTNLKGTIACRYYRLALAGADLIEIDVENMTRVINGVDQMEAIRAALEI